ncbi:MULTISPECIES: hypothetical protein [unclassified Candidatus Frackibacter]|uniref:hypothetical protein n=1 Tax=unclassified Candidatus Frackibacter TaxID=2648818 RepID=UPI000891BF64|nr:MULTISPECIES: hypothetical protein [unclassified Candidatus Frackibacter]SDC59822.1 hypothetical protein SAMN04515661_11540 [Candidatus Frackibacter sp. WG11]SEM42043.1 hypothetical protein SAMN04488698_103116 [Candidatus Frackibacter sp. WG12]SFL84761.1 hypothetical protein SAMN04488699_11623 [Candidatus Frackibacter sp. WG13]
MRTLIIRFGIVAILMLFIGFISTTFNSLAVLNLILVSLMISIANYLVKFILDEGTAPIIRGIVNFIVATIILTFFTGLGYGTFLAALIIGLLETIILTRI